jgi:predicted DNA-binding transcriptional regulator AlpA
VPWSDPYPGKEFLTVAEVRKLLGLTEPKAFKEFMDGEPLFPKPTVLGNTARGEPRLRFRKAKVLAFIDLMSG